jgi:hypothetical protein
MASSTKSYDMPAKLRVTGGLVEATLDLLWKQWRSLGAVSPGKQATTQVDPEALCLASLTLQSQDPRLWPTMEDWVRLGGRFLSLQRVKNLAVQFQVAQSELSRLAAAIHQGVQGARWRSLARGYHTQSPKGVSLEKQGKGGPALVNPPALVLRLRAAFTVGIKADVLAFLLGQRQRATIADAASSLGYATPAVFRAMQDLVAAELVRSVPRPAATQYGIDRKRWKAVLGGVEAPPWGYWREALTYVCAVFGWEEALESGGASEGGQGVAPTGIADGYLGDLTCAGFLDEDLHFPRSPDLEEWRDFHRGLAERVRSRA